MAPRATSELAVLCNLYLLYNNNCAHVTLNRLNTHVPYATPHDCINVRVGALRLGHPQWPQYVIIRLNKVHFESEARLNSPLKELKLYYL